MKTIRIKGWCPLLAGILLLSCGRKTRLDHPLFTIMEPDNTGIHFENRLHPTKDFNLFTYMYYYNGAGVAAGDFNNDGLIDLFFCANQGPNKIFLNKGGMKFEEATAAASVPNDSSWSTGVSVVDINNDGLLDLYICKVGNFKMLKGKNQLLVCQGIKNGRPVYKDEAEKYGLGFSGFSTQAVFFDYDLDGDLDLFLLNHSVNHDGNYAPREKFLNTFDSLAGQKLFRNDSHKMGDGSVATHFTDVTRQSGINGSRIGYGLGVVVSDINMDGWPDFYVGNDFHENDYLYINQKDGSFKEMATQMLAHTSQFSMGVDAADITNDGYPEIISADMLPYDPKILLRSLAQDDYNVFLQKRSFGYSVQYARNNLQLNLCNGKFAEVGQYANVFASDWSWAPLFVDLNNDGKKDLFISNGIPKRMNDIDYINFVSNDELQLKLKEHKMEDNDLSLIDKFPEIKIPNKFFINGGDVQFREITDSIENNKMTFSNGAVYADLDNDGDLDVVVNNIDDPAMIYENHANDSKGHPSAKVILKGAPGNNDAIGAKIVVYTNSEVRTYENYPVKGFQSSMLTPLLVGLYGARVDSSILIWPDGSFQSLKLSPGKTDTVYFEKGLPKFDYASIARRHLKPPIQAEDITDQLGIGYAHVENPFNEFTREPLLAKMISAEGPAVAVADINNDGREDFFVGASKGMHNAVYMQLPNGKFERRPQPDMEKDSMWGNVSAIWADVNRDSYPDLVIASGGNEYYGHDRHLLPLLYINDGKGNLKRKEDAFTGIFTTQSVVAAADINKDGAIDLFIGSRSVPWEYGKPSRSYLLQNDGTGKFTDVTDQFFSKDDLNGMVTGAAFTDLNGNGNDDLIVCYDWGGIDWFAKRGNRFQKKILTDRKGWWNVVLPADINQDGKMDIVAGNIGWNTPLKATKQEPVRMYYNDFDDNGKSEQLITYYLGGREIPLATKMELEKQLPVVKKKYLFAADFSKASIEDLFGKQKLKEAIKYETDYMGSAVLLNKGNSQFEVMELPFEAQLSSVRDLFVDDFDHDGRPDILLGSNYYYNNTQIGRQDADWGTVLLNRGGGKFDARRIQPVIAGEVRKIRPIHIGKSVALILAKNNQRLQVIRFP